jgi:hypothetical protein
MNCRPRIIFSKASKITGMLLPALRILLWPHHLISMLRRDFPILAERVNGKQLVWFDNAATTQKPQSVIDRLSYFYAHENSNIHRAAHELAARQPMLTKVRAIPWHAFWGRPRQRKLSSFAVQRKRLIWSPILSVKSLSVPVMNHRVAT